MRLSRIGLGMVIASMGMSGFAHEINNLSSSMQNLSNVFKSTQPQHISKPNKVSQAKRRKYKRQGRG